MSGMEGWSGMDGLVTKTRSIPWRGVLALIGGFLIQVGQKKLSISGQKKVRKCTDLSSALTRLLLLFWQHDDLPHFLHEVAVIYLTFGSSVILIGLKS